MCNSPLELLLLLWVWALDDGCFLVTLHYAGRKQLALKYFKGWWRTGVIVLTPIIFCPIPFAFDLTSVSFCVSLVSVSLSPSPIIASSNVVWYIYYIVNQKTLTLPLDSTTLCPSVLL